MANGTLSPTPLTSRPNCDAPAVLRQLCSMAGITINGDAPCDIRIHDPQVYRQVLTRGSLGFGESYIEGMWDCDQLDELFARLLSFDPVRQLPGLARAHLAWNALRQKLINLQSRSRAFQVGEQHYDVGNDLFERMLDSQMIYSCAYWLGANTLEEAQNNKLELICKKLQLKAGETLLDIGCGWGGLAAYAARNHGVRVTGITISREQQKLARERCQGLPVTIELMDYRDLKGQFDKIVSVGMFEHVGPKNYPAYFKSAQRLLKDDGLFLLHTIGNRRTVETTDAWIDKYVFPNGKLPSACDLSAAVENQFIIEDWHNFGADYDLTLMAWKKRFDTAWPQLREKYGERFYRMWTYYLLCCAGFFRARQGQLWQVVLAKTGRKNIYRSIR